MKYDFMGWIVTVGAILVALCLFKLIEPLVGSLVKLIKG